MRSTLEQVFDCAMSLKVTTVNMHTEGTNTLRSETKGKADLAIK